MKSLGLVLVGGTLLLAAWTSPSEVPPPQSPVVLSPTAVEVHLPAYPEPARRARMQGTVIVRVAVKPEGVVTDVTVHQGINTLLDHAAVSASRTWRFHPFTGPDERTLYVTFAFSLGSITEGCFLYPAMVQVRAVPPPNDPMHGSDGSR